MRDEDVVATFYGERNNISLAISYIFSSNSKCSLFGVFVRLLIIVQLRKTPGRVDSGTHFERSPSQNMRTQLKFDRNYGLTWEIACG